MNNEGLRDPAGETCKSAIAVTGLIKMNCELVEIYNG